MRNINVHNYYISLKKLFPQMYYKEGRFLHDFRKSLNEYAISHPNCTYEDLENYFGKTEDIVSEYLTCHNSDYILKCIKKKKYTKHILLALIIFLLVTGVIFSIFCFLAYQKYQSTQITYGNYNIVTEENYPNEDEKK